MGTVFIRETGICPWEQLSSTEESEYAMISLINQDFESVWKTWCALALVLMHEWPIILTWYTTMHPQYSKMHEYLTLKDFTKSSGPKDIFKKNEESLVYSGIEYLNPNQEHIDSSRLKGYRSSVTLMLRRDICPEQLWLQLSDLNCISTTDDFKLILKDKFNLAFRFYDAETHGIAQLICHSMHLLKLSHAITSLNIREISKAEVYKYIHS